MRHTRRRYIEVLQYEKAYTSVKWTHEVKNEVSLVGDFTMPVWKVFLRMEYCSLRGVYVKYLANLKEGEEYCYSFVVDGRKMPHHKHFVAGRAHVLGDMRINTLSSSRTSKWEERSIVTPTVKPIEEPSIPLVLPPAVSLNQSSPVPPPPVQKEDRAEEPNPVLMPPVPQVPSYTSSVTMSAIANIVPELATEEKDESRSLEVPPVPESKLMEEMPPRTIMSTEYKTPTTETENKSDKTSSIDKGLKWNPEEEFASFPISKRENEDGNNPPLFGKERNEKLIGNVPEWKERTPGFPMETISTEDAEERVRQRELIEKERMSGGKADINFDMAFDYVPDDYYS